MNHKSTTYFSILFILILVIANSCKPKEKTERTIDPAFTSYITAFTSGQIPNDGNIRIRLANDLTGDYSLNESPDLKLFQFIPEITGDVVIMDSRTIEFRPAERLKQGTEYTATFFLDKLIPDIPSELKKFEFDFRTIRQSFTVDINGMSAYNNKNLRWNRARGLIRTADYIEDEEIEKVLSARQEGRELVITWIHDPDGVAHEFTIDSINRKEEESLVTIEWNGAKIDVDYKGSEELKIPSLADFSIMTISVVQQPEQYVLIRFSDPLMAKQYLDGLIHMENGTDLRFIVENNEVRAYPSVRQTGQLEVITEPGIKNISGFRLKKAETYQLNFEEVKPAVRLAGKGVILPDSDGLIFPFEAVNLRAVEVRIIRIFENNIAQFLQVNRLDGGDQLKRVGRLVLKKTVKLSSARPVDYGNWNTFYIDLSELIQAEPGALYRVELNFKKKHSIYLCEGELQDLNIEEDDLIGEDEDDSMEEEMSYWDSYESNYEEGYYYWDYNWEERENPCSDFYYGDHRSVARNILASDLGIIAKQGNDKSMTFAVADLKTATPLAGVSIEVYNYQQQLLAESQTDASGLTSVELSGKPFLLIAKHGDQRGYLRLDDGSSLSLSRFDVSGKVIEKGLKGFIYGERGVWRPGDTLYLTFMLEDKKQVLPENHPVSFELFNPQQQLVYKSVKTRGKNGFYSFITSTDQDAPTGNWLAKINIGGTVFSERIRIETVKPNRLKINLDFGTEKLSVSQGKTAGKLEAQWLHGAVADRLDATVAVSYTTIPTLFNKYSDFTFDDKIRRFYSDENVIYDGRLDSEGKAEFYPELAPRVESPGMLKASFVTRVFEESGEYSIDRFSLPYSPYSGYIGIKTPKGDKARGMLLTDTTHIVEIVTLDADGNPVNRDKVDVSLYKLNWRWWWDASYENLASYVGSGERDAIISKKINTRRGEGEFPIKIEYPAWGRYMVRAVDPVSGHASSKIVYIDWPGWAGRAERENPGGAAMLSFSANKEKYSVGELATITFPSAGHGRALFSLENGSGVVSAEWIETREPETTHSFVITEDLAPNIFIHLSLVQPHAQTINDLPIRLYGIVPILVEDPETRLHPLLKMPEEIRPNSFVTIKVSEENKIECSYTLAIVDEGLLGLTRYRTPDAWSHFYAREALGVRTWDLYDMVIGAYGAQIESLLSIGGGYGEEEGEKSQSKANRFPPMVIYEGPFDLKKGQTRTHNIPIPNYIGAVRTMVVAGNQKAYGSSDKSVPVRQPLMVLGTLPRVLGPGETVDLPVTIFVMDQNVELVDLKLETNDLLMPAGDHSKQVRFSRMGDKVETFKLKVPSRLGIAKAKILASSGQEKSEYEIELDIRNPNPPVTNFVESTLDKNESWDGRYTLPGMLGTNTLSLEVSNIPPLDLERRLKFLLNYPHGCIEQTVSSVFPQLYLDVLVELDADATKKTKTNITAGIKRLQQFVLSNGAFGYWPDSHSSSEWGTNYAGHFLIEAEKKGYNIRSDIKKNWIKYQKKTAREWQRRSNQQHHDDLTQAYRLYTLALAGQPELGAMNRLRESNKLSVQARWRLAAAYAVTGQPEVSRELISEIPQQIEEYNGFNSTYGSRERDWAMILETLSQMDSRSEGARYAKMISEVLASRKWMSTQSTGYCLTAMAKFAGADGTSDELSFEYSHNGGKTIKARSNLPLVQVDLPVDEQLVGSINIDNSSDGVLFARIVMRGIPEKGDEQASSNNLSLNIRYTDLQKNNIDVSKIKQGTDLLVHVTVANPGALGDYKELALTQIFPSGWEIRNTRLDQAGFSGRADKPSYQDIRDDRIHTYFNLNSSRQKTFVYQVNAAYIGSFYLPAVYCEAMYENTVNATSEGMWVEVY